MVLQYLVANTHSAMVLNNVAFVDAKNGSDPGSFSPQQEWKDRVKYAQKKLVTIAIAIAIVVTCLPFPTERKSSNPQVVFNE